MTLIEKRRSEAPDGIRGEGQAITGSRRTWTAVAVVVVVALAVAIAMSHTGLAGDARGNSARPLAREHPPWGITHWPAVFSESFVGVGAAVAVVFGRLSS